MTYLIGYHALWLIASYAIGITVGIATFERRRARLMDALAWAAVIVWLFGAYLALTRALPDRAGHALELALLMSFVYGIGCFVGWVLRGVTADLEPELATASGHHHGLPPAAKPAPAVEAPKPAPAAEAPKPAPVVEAPKPVPMAEASKPAPLAEAPKLAVIEAPKPAEAPKPVTEAKAPEPTAEDARHAGNRPFGLAAPDGKPDDLKRIRGIGPQNEGRLHGLGIWHFRQIAAWTPENVEWVGSYLAFPGRIDREEWVRQAKVLATGAETEFSKRVDAGEVPTSLGDGTAGQGSIEKVAPREG